MTFIFGLMIYGFVFLLREPDFFDNVSCHFCVKSVYILKNEGEMLCGYNFHEEETEILLTGDQLLLGDFIYAISSGLKMALKLEESVDEVEIGDNSLVIKHGEKVFAILIISEHNEKIYDRINNFIEAFEYLHKDELNKKKMDISRFHSENTQKLLFDIFK